MGFDDLLSEEAMLAGMVVGTAYQRWVTQKFSGSYYDFEVHVNAQGGLAFI